MNLHYFKGLLLPGRHRHDSRLLLLSGTRCIRFQTFGHDRIRREDIVV